MIPTTSRLIDNNGNSFGVKHINGKPRTSSMPYLYDIAEGNVPDHSFVSKFGHDPTTTNSTIEVWDGSVAYPYWSSAVTLYISSSDNGDTQVYEVQGLDANWDLQTVRVTAAGFTSVALSGTWMRVFRIKNLGATDNAGIIYVSIDADAGGDGVPDAVATDSKAQISIGMNQTLMAIWAVPRAHTAYLTNFYASCADTTTRTTDIGLWVRPFGGVFQIKKLISINSGQTARIDYDFPLEIAGKSDVRVTANSSAAMEVSAGFDAWYEKG
jgi:hypothetical protein